MKRLLIGAILVLLLALGVLNLPVLRANVMVNQAHLVLARGLIPDGGGTPPEAARKAALDLYRQAAALEPSIQHRPYYRFLEYRVTGHSASSTPLCPDAQHIVVLGLKLADQFHREQRDDEAVSVYQWLSRGCPSSFETYYAWSDLEAEHGSFDRAIQLMETAVQMQPMDPSGSRPEALTELQRIRLAKGYYGLGELYAKIAQPERAIAALERSAATYPAGTASPWMYYLLGTLYHRAQRQDEARWAFQQSLALKPDLSEAKEYLERLSED